MKTMGLCLCIFPSLSPSPRKSFPFIKNCETGFIIGRKLISITQRGFFCSFVNFVSEIRLNYAKITMKSLIWHSIIAAPGQVRLLREKGWVTLA